MNWMRTLIAGVVGGIVVNLVDFVLHGIIMARAYVKYPVFSQEQANPAHFFLVAICVGITSAILFARTRSSWAAGVKGGITFGAFLGVAVFFSPFYNPLVLEGFPYHLAWCWGGIGLIDAVVFGAVVGAIYRE